MVDQNKIFSFKIKRQAKNVFPKDVERTIIASPNLFTKFYGTSSNSYLDFIAAKKNVTKGRTYEQTDNPKAFFEVEGIKNFSCVMKISFVRYDILAILCTAFYIYIIRGSVTIGYYYSTGIIFSVFAHDDENLISPRA